MKARSIQLPIHKNIHACDFHEQTTTLFVATSDNITYVDVKNKLKQVNLLQYFFPNKPSLLKCRPNKDGSYLASIVEKNIILWDYKDPSKPIFQSLYGICKIEHFSWSYQSAYHFATYTSDGYVSIGDIRNISQPLFNFHLEFVKKIEWCPCTENILAILTENSCIVCDLGSQLHADYPEGKATEVINVTSEIVDFVWERNKQNLWIFTIDNVFENWKLDKNFDASKTSSFELISDLSTPHNTVLTCNTNYLSLWDKCDTIYLIDKTTHSVQTIKKNNLAGFFWVDNTSYVVLSAYGKVEVLDINPEIESSYTSRSRNRTSYSTAHEPPSTKVKKYQRRSSLHYEEKYDKNNNHDEFTNSLNNNNNSFNTKNLMKFSNEITVIGPRTFAFLINKDLLYVNQECNTDLYGIRISKVDSFSRKIVLSCGLLVHLNIIFPIKFKSFWKPKYSFENNSDVKLDNETLLEIIHSIKHEKPKRYRGQASESDFIYKIALEFRNFVMKAIRDKETGLHFSNSHASNMDNHENFLESSDINNDHFQFENKNSLRTPYPVVSGGIFNGKGELLLFGKARLAFNNPAIQEKTDKLPVPIIDFNPFTSIEGNSKKHPSYFHYSDHQKANIYKKSEYEKSVMNNRNDETDPEVFDEEKHLDPLIEGLEEDEQSIEEQETAIESQFKIGDVIFDPVDEGVMNKLDDDDDEEEEDDEDEDEDGEDPEYMNSKFLDDEKYNKMFYPHTEEFEDYQTHDSESTLTHSSDERVSYDRRYSIEQQNFDDEYFNSDFDESNRNYHQSETTNPKKLMPPNVISTVNRLFDFSEITTPNHSRHNKRKRTLRMKKTPRSSMNRILYVSIPFDIQYSISFEYQLIDHQFEYDLQDQTALNSSNNNPVSHREIDSKIQICRHNAKVVEQFMPYNRKLIQFWNLLAVTLNTSQVVDTGEQFTWETSYLGKKLYQNLLDFLFSYHDVQLWATVINILGGLDNIFNTINSLELIDNLAKLYFNLSNKRNSSQMLLQSYMNNQLYKYAQILQQFGNEVAATKILKMCDIDDDFCREYVLDLATNFKFNCVYCKMCSSEIPHNITVNRGFVCENCELVDMKCVLCLEKVNGMITFCPRCGHGGHQKHLNDWFSINEMCPTGCGCNCTFTDEGIEFSNNLNSDSNQYPPLNFDKMIDEEPNLIPFFSRDDYC